MKKIKLIILSLTVAIALSSCGGQNSSPEKVASDFLEALLDCNIKDIKCTLDPNMSTKSIDELDQMFQDESYQFVMKAIKGFEIIGVEQTEDVATVKYSLQGLGGQNEEQDIRVVKIDGKWYVSDAM